MNGGNPLNRKGIILAGGTGSRLWPMTAVVSKQLLPVWDKPMIFYPLATLLEAGLTEILIISTPADISRFQDLLGDGSYLGVSLSFAIQPEPNGLAEALIIGEEFLNGSPAALILGDNLFYGGGITGLLKSANKDPVSTIFACHVSDPKRYGVVNFNKDGKAISLIEKPKVITSNFAVTGLYFYEANVSQLAKTLQPSDRKELEITDLNLLYLQNEMLNVKILSRETAWLDTGTSSSLLQASQFVEAMQSRQGTVVACLEEIAINLGLISPSSLKSRFFLDGKSGYSQYVKQLLDRLHSPEFKE